MIKTSLTHTNKVYAYILQHAFFPLENVQITYGNHNLQANHERSYLKRTYIYSAAGAFSPNKKSHISKTMRIFENTWKIIFKSSSVPQSLFSEETNENCETIWKSLNSHDKSYLKAHIYSAAGAFFLWHV